MQKACYESVHAAGYKLRNLLPLNIITVRLCLQILMSNSVYTTTSLDAEMEKSSENSITKLVDSSSGIFPKLPLELREHIYHYLLPPSQDSLNPLPPFLGLNLTADLAYNILHINKTTRVDAGIYYLRSRCFEIHGQRQQAYFERYLASFPGTMGYEAVRQLSFPRFSESQTGAVGLRGYMDLIEQCVGLMELKLTFAPQNLMRKPYLKLEHLSKRSERFETEDLTLASVEMVAERYGLARLLRLERLNRVKLILKQARTMTRELRHQIRDVAPDRLMSQVSEWLEIELLSHGLRVVVLTESAS